MSIKRTFMCIMIIALLCINTVYAVEISTVGEPHGICFDTVDTDKIIYTNSTSIKTVDILGGSFSDGVIEIPVTVSDVAVSDDFYYYLCTDGRVYKTEKSPGLKTFNIAPEVGNTILLDDVYAVTDLDTCILIDSDENVYINQGVYIYKIDSSNYLTSLYCTLPTTVNHISNNGTAIICSTSGTTAYAVTDVGTYHSIGSFAGYGDYSKGVYQLTNNHYVIYGWSGSATHRIEEFYENMTHFNTILPATGTTSFTGYKHMDISDTGIIAIFLPPENKIKTYATTDNIGAFSPVIGLQSSINYQQAEILSDYETYVNNSDIYTRFNIATGILTDDEQTVFKNSYAFRIELLNEEKTLLTYDTITGDTFKNIEFESISVFPSITAWINAKIANWLIGDNFLIKSGSNIFASSNNWDSGNYTINLYEINTVSGVKILLDSDSFIVLNKSYTSNYDSIENTEEQTNEEQVYSFIFSKYFIGLIGFVAIVKSIGVDKLGRINGTALTMGVVVADIVLVLTGIFPVWTIFVIVLFGLVLLGKRSTEGGD